MPDDRNKLPQLGWFEQLFIALFFGLPGGVLATFGGLGLWMRTGGSPDLAPNPAFAWAFVIGGAMLIVLCGTLFVRFLRSPGRALPGSDATLPGDANPGH